jgi:hypothetical protein
MADFFISILAKCSEGDRKLRKENSEQIGTELEDTRAQIISRDRVTARYREWTEKRMDIVDRDSLTDKNKVEERRLKVRDQIQKETIEKGKA